jgi:hypothetical protein
LPKKITESTEKILRELVANAKKKDGRIWNPNLDFIEKNKDIIAK